MQQAAFVSDFASWRNEARKFLSRDVKPDHIIWPGDDTELSFFGAMASDEPRDVTKTAAPRNFGATTTGAGNVRPQEFKIDREFIELARFASCARDPKRWSLLYRILYRLKHENKSLVKIVSDPDIVQALHLQKMVRTDIHKMHAFVRFKQTVLNGQDIYAAWHAPSHLCHEEAIPFFVRRFGDKPWIIFTPDKSAYYDGQSLHWGAGIPQHKFTIKDDFDEMWKSYYASIFNPARIKIKAMQKEMPKKYWQSLPEAEIIRDLLKRAPSRLQDMAKNQKVQAKVNENDSLQDIAGAARRCRACPLYEQATQTVFGEGPETAEIVIVGEQPGDNEDLAGRAFIGPAGEVLAGALQRAGLKREQIYITNAVKHFKFERRGKIRIHKKPSGTEMHACRPWLEAELKKIKPKVIIALGATAATSVLGRLPKIIEERGRLIKDSPYADAIFISWHPSAILRAGNEDDSNEKREQLAQDIMKAVAYLDHLEKK